MARYFDDLAAAVPASTDLFQFETVTAHLPKKVTLASLAGSIAVGVGGYVDRYPDAGTIPGSTNLDTYAASGIYHQNLSANAASGSNYPVAIAGMLLVYTANSVVYQTYQRFDNGERYHRSRTGGVWSTWRMEVTLQSARIMTDMSSSPGTRLYFQTTTTNGVTSLDLAPNGSGSVSGITAYNTSTPANAGYTQLLSNGTQSILQMGQLGTGTAPTSLSVQFAGAERLKLDAFGTLTVPNSEIVSTFSNPLRMVQGNYGMFFRQDGTDLYLLATNSGDQYGGWNSLRPLRIQNSTGNVWMGHAVEIGGALTLLSPPSTYTGTVSAQTTMQTHGWANGVARARWIMETDASLSLYGYDSSGATATRAVNFKTAVSGGSTVMLVGNITAADVAADRGDGTGVIFLGGGGGHYLYYNGVDYHMPAAGLVVNGGPVLTSDTGTFRIEGQCRAYNRFQTLAADATAWVDYPRFFVQSGDPGAKAQDNDVWGW